ncbi:MAG: hypothetical protein ACRDKX_09345 [Solirubrobacterales bacterium]
MTPMLGDSPNYVGAVDVDETVQFLEEAITAATAALQPSRRLLDDSRARPIATQLAAAFADAKALYDDSVGERERIGRDTTTRPQLLHERLGALRAEYQRQTDEIERRIHSLVLDLETALRDEALPRSSGPSEILVARQEIEAALRADTKRDPGQRQGPFSVMIGIAEAGGELAAAAASGWGESIYIAHGGTSEEHAYVRVAAAEASLTGSDEGPRRAAEALGALGLRTRQGVPEAIAKMNFALIAGGEMLLVSPWS